MYRYLHRLIATPIASREQSHECCNLGDSFYMYCLIWRQSCALACCLAEWFVAAFHGHERGLLYGGAYIMQIAI
ncbi:hypothetical protein Hanom_Chr06g00527031 [Helianthus anomalus]